MKIIKKELANRIEYRSDDSGSLHREDGPALIYTGTVYQFLNQWYWQGIQHRIDGPAYYYTEGQYLPIKKYYVHGSLHRVGGPAFCDIYLHGYWKNGKKHRLNAPATTGKGISKEWWEFGSFIR